MTKMLEFPFEFTFALEPDVGFRNGYIRDDPPRGVIVPLADACRFLERHAANLLRPKKLGWGGRPALLWGVSCELHREPFGAVLIIGPGNYPLMLPAVQAVQALVAGNTVLLKPAPGCGRALTIFADTLRRLGVPDGILQVLDESTAAAQAAAPSTDRDVLIALAASRNIPVEALSQKDISALVDIPSVGRQRLHAELSRVQAEAKTLLAF